MKNRVFLSYSQRDRDLATAFRQELKKLGVSTFDPVKDLKAGTEWRKAIMDGIRQSDWVVVLWTRPQTAESTWIGYEVGSASALGKDIVVMKPTSYSASDLPSDLAGWRTLDFEPSSPNKMAKTLVSSLAATN
jgi:hypothetical protein